MVQLQRIQPRLEDEQIALYAVSYDSEQVVRRFAERADISFPLLSDPGSLVIERLGLLNTQVRQEHDATGVAHDDKYEGVSHPVTFLLDTDGVVIGRRYHPDYRVRESGSALVALGFDVEWPPPAAEVAETAVVRVEVACEDGQFDPFQMLWCEIRLDIADGWYVNGDPAPPGLIPLRVTTLPREHLIVGPSAPPAPTSEPGLRTDEAFPRHAGATTVRFPVTVALDDPVDVVVEGSVTFQACRDGDCLPPETVLWSLTLAPRGIPDP